MTTQTRHLSKDRIKEVESTSQVLEKAMTLVPCRIRLSKAWFTSFPAKYVMGTECFRCTNAAEMNAACKVHKATVLNNVVFCAQRSS